MWSSLADKLGESGKRGLLTGWALVFSALLYLTTIKIDIAGQQWLAAVLIAVLFFMRGKELRGVLRVMFLFIAVYLTLRYFFWRTTETLSYYDLASYIAALALYSAELYGIAIYLLGVFVNVNPLHRKPPSLSGDPSQWPSVDIMIPSYNEPADMLEQTLLAALQVRYAPDRLRVYLLDDGGTLKKRSDPDPQKAAEAHARHLALRALCERCGAHYLTREKNNHAKAGNINAALAHTHGDLVLILDADHVPTVDILEKTVGLFQRDEKMFLVQTPHFFINADPVEKNLHLFGNLPSENEMFYSDIQRGLDWWGSSFFCGSAAILRRKYLEEVGGISGMTITEDAETALDLHALGYRSAYVNHPLISGLQPETYTSFIVQRMRWAQGMAQIFILKNPLFKKGLRFWQRLAYTSSSFFWFFSYARIVFLLAPAAYLIFGLKIYDANLAEFLGYAVPHVVGAIIVSDFLYGKTRWAFISELYELMQSFYTLPAIFKVLRNPRAPEFMVTPKGEQLKHDFISKLSKPFYAVYLLTWVSFFFGVYRYVDYPELRDMTSINMGWQIFNVILLNAAIGALFERHQLRGAPRMPADLPAQLELSSGAVLPCRVKDLSSGGALLAFSKACGEALANVAGSNATLVLENKALRKQSALPIKVVNRRPLGANIALGACFVRENQAVVAEVVSLVYGDSQRWVEFRNKRNAKQGVLKCLFVLLSLGFRCAMSHFYQIIKVTWLTFYRYVGGLLPALWRWVVTPSRL